jgi:4-diphosphocytidyl-2-C-methyl-D-erythritol kinase
MQTMSTDSDNGGFWPAPAKLNLFLHITGQRADGFHTLQTVFQFLDFGDRLRFRVRADGVVSRTRDLPGVPEAEDLVVRAARLLQTVSGVPQGADIEIDKHIPMGGGLGGGSSDAATTLVALNRQWDCGFGEDDLARMGQELGADVPVFVRGQAAWAEGIGEILTPVILPEPWFVVLCPALSVSTAEVFSLPQLRRDCPPITIRDFLDGRDVENVCEPPVRARYPEVEAALRDLAVWAPAHMTGTGACIFAPFDSEMKARQVFAELMERWPGFVAKGCNISPLRARDEECRNETASGTRS